MGTSLPSIPPELILWDIVEEHLDEAAFLFTQWERALQSPVLTLQRVAETVEARLLAHLDGLAVAGSPAVHRLLLPALHEGTRGEAFAAAFALLALDDEPGPRDGASMPYARQVLTALEEAGKRQRPGIQRALELSDRRGFEPALLTMLESERPELRAAGLEVLGFRRVDPGLRLTYLLCDPDPGVCLAALRAAGRAASPQYLPYVMRQLDAPDPALREQALTTALILGSREAWSRCRALGNPAEGPSATVLTLLSILGGPQEHRQVFRALEHAVSRRAAVFALGFSGQLEVADRLLELMADKDLGPLAGEAFAGITGVDLAMERLTATRAPKDEPEEPVPLEQEVPVRDLGLDPDDDLPIPDPAAVTAWWGRQRAGFNPAGRYILGRPVAETTLWWALEVAPMRRRPGLALEMALRTRGRLQLETGTLAETQRRLLRSQGAA